jgi:hypothetical protein
LHWARRRGLAGEPLWLAVAIAAWLVRRSLRQSPPMWSERLEPGDQLTVTTMEPRDTGLGE